MVDILATTGESQRSAVLMRGMNVAKVTIAAIHQPNYIPWLGYFYKIAHADKFIFLDVVAYTCGSFINRNYIKTPHGPAWLTIPVLRTGRFGQRIGDVETLSMGQWADRHLATIRNNYRRADYFKEIMSLLEPHYSILDGNSTSLADFNIKIICSIAAYLGIDTEFIRGSQLHVSGNKTELLLDICRTVNAATYLSGAGAQSYQDDKQFQNAGITPVYSAFSQRMYPQLYGEFVGNLSIVDVLMNCGRRGTRLLLDLEPRMNNDVPSLS